MPPLTIYSRLTRNTIGNQPNHPHPIMFHTRNSKTSSSTSQPMHKASRAFHHIATVESLNLSRYTPTATVADDGLYGYGSSSSSFSLCSSSAFRSLYLAVSTTGTLTSISVAARGVIGTTRATLASIDNRQWVLVRFGVQNCNYMELHEMESALLSEKGIEMSRSTSATIEKHDIKPLEYIHFCPGAMCELFDMVVW
jgi:hypothetical protein